jgi:hypothetical protein
MSFPKLPNLAGIPIFALMSLDIQIETLLTIEKILRPLKCHRNV